MFGPLGVPEILFILVLALLIFGPRKLPEVGRTLGKAMGEFRRATTELKRSVNTEIALEDDDERPRYTRSARPDRRLEGEEDRGEGDAPERSHDERRKDGGGRDGETGSGREAVAGESAESGAADGPQGTVSRSADPRPTDPGSSRDSDSGSSDSRSVDAPDDAKR